MKTPSTLVFCSLAAQSECNDAQLKSQLAELQAALATRNKQIETLMDDQANQVNHQDRQLQQLEAEHAVELAKSEARIRELEQELKRLLSPPPIPRHTVRPHAYCYALCHRFIIWAVCMVYDCLAVFTLRF